MPVLRNVKCKWASVQEPNRSKEYGDKWEIDAELTPEQATAFEAEGFTTKQDDKGIDCIRFKRKTTGVLRKGGTFDKPQPKVLDSVKQAFTGLIGNGSVVNIAYNVLEHKFGKSLDLAGVQVLELVSYGGGGDDASDEFEVVGATSQASDGAATFDEDDLPF
tara:strand:+ start:1871 stop:2356 length:486 start_codon:yes stop_codon:yes gene_type:complete